MMLTISFCPPADGVVTQYLQQIAWSVTLTESLLNGQSLSRMCQPTIADPAPLNGGRLSARLRVCSAQARSGAHEQRRTLALLR